MHEDVKKVLKIVFLYFLFAIIIPVSIMIIIGLFSKKEAEYATTSTNNESNQESLINSTKPQTDSSQETDSSVAIEGNIEDIYFPNIFKYDLESFINEKIGEKAVDDKERIVDIVIVDSILTKEEGDFNVEITLNSNEGLMKNSMLRDTQKLMEYIYNEPKIANATISWYYPMSDVYGNKSDVAIMRTKLTKEIAQKINWENFDAINLPTVAANYFEHEAFDK